MDVTVRGLVEDMTEIAAKDIIAAQIPIVGNDRVLHIRWVAAGAVEIVELPVPLGIRTQRTVRGNKENYRIARLWVPDEVLFHRLEYGVVSRLFIEQNVNVFIVVGEAKFFAGQQSPHGCDIVAGPLEIGVDQRR